MTRPPTTGPPASAPDDQTTAVRTAKHRTAVVLHHEQPLKETIMADATLTLPGGDARAGFPGDCARFNDRVPPSDPPAGTEGHIAGLEWREVPDWPAYQVSSDGQVRRAVQSRGAKGGRILKPLLNRKTGYYSVCLSRQSRQRRIDVHRLVALAFLGPQPSGRHLVAHNDGARTNNAARNLRWATQSENLSDCHHHGTARIGSKNPRAWIVEIDVLAMRRMKAAGIPRPVIAAGYGMHKRSVFKILAGTSWEHVL